MLTLLIFYTSPLPCAVLQVRQEYLISCVVTAPDVGLSIVAEYPVETIRSNIMAVISGEWRVH